MLRASTPRDRRETVSNTKSDSRITRWLRPWPTWFEVSSALTAEAASVARSMEREPIATRAPALAHLRASPRPSSPVPPISPIFKVVICMLSGSRLRLQGATSSRLPPHRRSVNVVTEPRKPGRDATGGTHSTECPARPGAERRRRPGCFEIKITNYPLDIRGPAL